MSGGHGHVVPRADGCVARCGGPAICRDCALEAQRWAQQHGKAWSNAALSITAEGTVFRPGPAEGESTPDPRSEVQREIERTVIAVSNCINELRDLSHESRVWAVDYLQKLIRGRA